MIYDPEFHILCHGERYPPFGGLQDELNRPVALPLLRSLADGFDALFARFIPHGLKFCIRGKLGDRTRKVLVQGVALFQLNPSREWRGCITVTFIKTGFFHIRADFKTAQAAINYLLCVFNSFLIT